MKNYTNKSITKNIKQKPFHRLIIIQKSACTADRSLPQTNNTYWNTQNYLQALNISQASDSKQKNNKADRLNSSLKGERIKKRANT